jgi:hypothetical protein
MEQKPASPPEVQNPPPAPVMDVVPPPALDKSETAAPSDSAVSQDDKPVDPKANDNEKADDKGPAKPTTPKPPKQPGNGVGLAIVATVVIVLSLAVLATYAYIKTQK